MALSAILGLNTAEALNLACCKNNSVSRDNTGYVRLLQETGLPSLHEMACRDAVTAQIQISKIRPQWYKQGTKRQQAIAKQQDTSTIVGVAKECIGTLVDELNGMDKEYMNTYMTVHKNREKEKGDIHKKFKTIIEKAKETNDNKKLNEHYRDRKREILSVNTPCFSRYFMAMDYCKNGTDIDYLTLFRTYTL